MVNINFSKIEKKWQEKWEKKKCFEVKEGKGKKFYVLEMFPYPSSSGLHMGHALNYTIGDIFARFKRMNKFNVLYPIGFDSLGLPAENAAIKAKFYPKPFTEKAIRNYIRQMKEIGLSYDWNRMIKTHESDYYKWDQWIFLKMFEKGLVHKKESPVNWCKKCNTVLANEQVHNGKCWRHEDINVKIKHLNQWYLKITDYAEELNNFKDLKEWPDLIKKLQKNWIGKSYGTEIMFEINREKWPIFTTRPDTIYGVTFMVVSAQHPRLMELVTDEQRKKVNDFMKKLKSVSNKDLDEEWMQREGVFTGSYAINPANGLKIPIYAANFVIADYGSGMVMADAHDQRDLEFAQKYGINLIPVLKPKDGEADNPNKAKRAFTDYGILINSKKFNGLDSKTAIKKITNWLIKKKVGKRVINFKLKDWLISRQRYWGTPIPIIYCDECGVVPVPEKDLPVKLPEKVKFGKGNPLTTNERWINTKCPKCGKFGKRETDTMDTFVNSSWYYLRYCDSKNKKEIFDKKKANYWCPVDLYIGGKEHACMHLIYIRFYTKFLRDLGLLRINEPAIRLFNQGMLHGSDGEKMSKSKGNVILPEQVSKKYGIDTARLFLVSIASPDKDIDWSEKGVQGSLRFIKKIVDYFNKIKIGKSSKKIESKINKIIKEITQDIENLRYNLAVIKLRKLFESFEKEEKISKKDLESFLKMLSVFCPHITEELWERLGNRDFVSLSKWPKHDEKKIDIKLEKQEEQVEKLKQDINNIKRITGKKEAKVFVYVLPNEKEIYSDLKDIEVFAVNDKVKYDPEGKSKKAKPGKPAIYLE
jgi:leucyl-tRNA synthetase